VSDGDEQAALDLAFQAALAARRETFLARLPRAFKLALLLVILMGIGVGAAVLWPMPKPGETAAEQERKPAQEAHEAAAQPIQEAEQAPPQAPKQAPPPMRQANTDAEKAAVAFNDSDELSARMKEAPDMELAQETGDGFLPQISPDGRKPWTVYARPFDRMDPRPRIVLVVVDLGLSRIATDSALRRLPSDVTLTFDAQSDALGAWLKRARQDGHETLIALPMEPLDFPRSDPGPGALLTSLPNTDNLDRLESFMRRGVGYVGITTLTGSRFTTDSEKILPVLKEMQDRGLMVLDTHLAEHSVVYDLARKLQVPVAVCAVSVDSDPTPQAIDAALANLEQTARLQGRVIAMATPLPVTLERIEAWTKGLAARGFVLTPISAVVE